MINSSARRLGLVILGILSLGDIATIFLTDGKNPPYAVAVVALILGLASLILVGRAFRAPSRPLGLLIALRLFSAVAALPAFFVTDVPAGARVAAASIVVFTAIGILLTARGRVAAVAA